MFIFNCRYWASREMTHVSLALNPEFRIWLTSIISSSRRIGFHSIITLAFIFLLWLWRETYSTISIDEYGSKNSYLYLKLKITYPIEILRGLFDNMASLVVNISSGFWDVNCCGFFSVNLLTCPTDKTRTASSIFIWFDVYEPAMCSCCKESWRYPGLY